ncbi:unnamed protein product [Gongylonema pulchrum]|uniref:Uncharacterized protein n=1 Tax=Gongylonema pulchrum TaxID=637853 RepID=A0A3P6TW03_9BILA|nr:unnamed protein product [Gongylonema pulchrum]
MQDLILPLVECAQQALRRKGGELTYKKAVNLLNIVLKHKREQLTEKKAVKLLDKLVLTTTETVNPEMRNILGSITSFLFAACYDAKENVVAESMRSKMFGLLEQYITDGNSQILSEIIITPFIKYPQAFLSELPRIMHFAFDESTRTFQRVCSVLLAHSSYSCYSSECSFVHSLLCSVVRMTSESLLLPH